MEYLYCGGRFDFDYMQDGYVQKAAEDYRAVLLGDVRKLLNNQGHVRLSDRLSYAGPFYFETDGMKDLDIVHTEMAQIERCTTAVFLLDGADCPGTVGEMVYAASLHKQLRVFYIQNEKETESTLRSPCWYPMLLCQQIDPVSVKLIPCTDGAEAMDRIVDCVRALAHKESCKREKAILTDRLILRPFRGSDYDDLYEFLSQLRDDPFEAYPGITYENGRKHLQERLDSDEFYAMEQKDSGKVIGNVYCGKRAYDAREVGYILNQRFQRQGYASEALLAVIRNAFREGAHRVYAECDPNNVPSWKLLEKVGMKREACLRQSVWFREDEYGSPVWKDTLVYAMLEKDLSDMGDLA